MEAQTVLSVFENSDNATLAMITRKAIVHDLQRELWDIEEKTYPNIAGIILNWIEYPAGSHGLLHLRVVFRDGVVGDKHLNSMPNDILDLESMVADILLEHGDL